MTIPPLSRGHTHSHTLTSTRDFSLAAKAICGFLLPSRTFFQLIRVSVRCSRVSGLSAQRTRLLALMVSADQVPNRFPDYDVPLTLDECPGWRAYIAPSYQWSCVSRVPLIAVNLRAVQLLLGHTKMDSTVRYLGVELEDALAIAEAIEI